MVTASFVMSAYTVKDDKIRRQVKVRSTKLRYFIVVLAIMAVFGCQYCFDNPSALQDQIEHNQQISRGSKMGEAEFNLLYSLYSLPNIVVPLIGGILIDTKGPRITLIITAAFCVIGQVVFGIGGLSNIWAVMLLGRFIFGIGGEVLHAAQNTFVSRWFKASELSMVLGICLSFPKMGSSLNAVVSPSIGRHFQETQKQGQYLNVGMPIAVGLGFMLFSFVCTLLLWYYDKKTEKTEKIAHQSQVLSHQKSKIQSINPIGSGRRSGAYKQVNMLERTQINRDDSQSTEVQGGHFSCKAIKKLPLTYWILLLVAMLSQALFIPFLDNGNKYFRIIYKSIETSDEAGTYLILPYVVSSITVIPLGYFVDKFKNRGYALIGSCTFIMITYLFMMYVQTDATLRKSTFIPWIPVFLLGICIAIFCTVIVPTIPMVVPPELLGSGFGMMEMLQNFGLSVFPLLAGFIRETQDRELQGFHIQTLFFFLVSCVCLGASILLETTDRFRGNKLKKKDFRKTYIKKVMGE